MNFSFFAFGILVTINPVQLGLGWLTQPSKKAGSELTKHGSSCYNSRNNSWLQKAYFTYFVDIFEQKCCQIDCFTLKDCKQANSAHCSSAPVECAMGEYRNLGFTLAWFECKVPFLKPYMCDPPCICSRW